MTIGQAQGDPGRDGARAWATFQEPHARLLYDTVHERLGIGPGTRLLDVGCGPGSAALLSGGHGWPAWTPRRV